jgi:hypothetical protein
MRITVAPAVETVPDHTGGAAGTVTVSLVFSGLSHTDTAISDLKQFEGDLAVGGILNEFGIGAKLLSLVASLHKL